MVANVQPIYTQTPRLVGGQSYNSGTVLGPSANTAEDGSGNNTFGFFQAGSNAGSYVKGVRFTPVLSPAATKARLWACSATSGTFTGGTTNTATNMTPLGEVTLPAVTVSLTIQGPSFYVPLADTLPASTWLAVTFETSTGGAGTGWALTTDAGDY